MPVVKPLSRRTFLKGAGNVAIALPFLDAMIPTFAKAQGSPQFRYISVYWGSVNGGDPRIIPSATGPLNAALGDSIKSLEDVKQHINIISKLYLHQVHGATDPIGPGEAKGATHGKVESPILSGVRSLKGGEAGFDNTYALVRGTTADQIAAQFLGPGSKYPSLQVQLQASMYNGTNRPPRAISVIKKGSILNELTPTISPLQLYQDLFSGSLPSSQPNVPISSLPLKQKSVLDLVLDDATRLMRAVSGQDKERLELHFEHIRDIERSLASTSMPGGGGGGGGSVSCTAPAKPGADPSIDTTHFGGWGNETLRGEVQAALIAHAIQCGLTNVVSWALSHNQVWLNSTKISGSSEINPESNGKADIHHDSHNSSAQINAANHNWAVNNVGLLIRKLANMQDAHGSLLDHTFIGYVTAEGHNAHNRSSLTYITAGCKARMKNGIHVATAGKNHPAQVLTTGLQAIGMNTDTLGEVSGIIPGLLK